MREFQQQKHRRGKLSKWLFSPLVIAVLAVAVVALGRSVGDLYGKERDTAEKLATQQAKHKELAASQAALSQEITRLQTPEGADEAIRSTYNVTLPGEKLVIIMASGTPTTSSQGN